MTCYYNIIQIDLLIFRKIKVREQIIITTRFLLISQERFDSSGIFTHQRFQQMQTSYMKCCQQQYIQRIDSGVVTRSE